MPEPCHLLGSAGVFPQVGADVAQEASRQASAESGGMAAGVVEAGWGHGTSNGQHHPSFFPLLHLNPFCLSTKG